MSLTFKSDNLKTQFNDICISTQRSQNDCLQYLIDFYLQNKDLPVQYANLKRESEFISDQASTYKIKLATANGYLTSYKNILPAVPGKRTDKTSQTADSGQLSRRRAENDILLDKGLLAINAESGEWAMADYLTRHPIVIFIFISISISISHFVQNSFHSTWLVCGISIFSSISSQKEISKCP